MKFGKVGNGTSSVARKVVPVKTETHGAAMTKLSGILEKKMSKKVVQKKGIKKALRSAAEEAAATKRQNKTLMKVLVPMAIGLCCVLSVLGYILKTIGTD